MYTHYAIASFSRSGLERGMYSRSDAYSTPELAKRFGVDGMRRYDHPGLALVMVETRDEDGRRALIRETVIEILSEPTR